MKRPKALSLFVKGLPIFLREEVIPFCTGVLRFLVWASIGVFLMGGLFCTLYALLRPAPLYVDVWAGVADAIWLFLLALDFAGHVIDLGRRDDC